MTVTVGSLHALSINYTVWQWHRPYDYCWTLLLYQIALCVCNMLPVCFEVVFQMCRPGERPAATLKRAAQDLLGEGAAGSSRQLSLVPVCYQTVCVVT